jgi:Arc/MetJ-type ribon-helix-helix transcriptional regulator
MDTMNVSLTPEQSEYVRRTVARDFGDVSEFFRDLLRERMKQEIDADVAYLNATVSNAQAGPNDEQIKDVLGTQRKVRQELKRARRA